MGNGMARADSVDTVDTTIKLRDGRTLAYAEYGVSSGTVLLYFHGGAASRLEARFLVKPAERAGVRLIGIDRPGMGRSGFRAGRRVLDWPDDVVELADSLRIERFAVVGISGGGPYALACAYKIPDRLIACGVGGGEWHHKHVFSFLTQYLPWLLIPPLGYFFRDEEHARNSMLRLTPHFPETDRKSLALPEISELLTASFVEAFRQGVKGPAYDGMVVRRSWGFKLEAITFPKLYLWHGQLDRDVPVAIGRALAERLVHCHATFYPDEGHISLIVNRGDEIVTTLMSQDARFSVMRGGT
jgi:pimeloyl-ACP methyl ester carboxylesterase